MNYDNILHIDGHESKPAISILAIVQESRKTSAFCYFSSYSFYFITKCSLDDYRMTRIKNFKIAFCNCIYIH